MARSDASAAADDTPTAAEPWLAALVPGDGARLGETRLDDWLSQTAGMKTAVA